MGLRVEAKQKGHRVHELNHEAMLLPVLSFSLSLNYFFPNALLKSSSPVHPHCCCFIALPVSDWVPSTSRLFLFRSLPSPHIHHHRTTPHPPPAPHTSLSLSLMAPHCFCLTGQVKLLLWNSRVFPTGSSSLSSVTSCHVLHVHCSKHTELLIMP